MRDMYNYGYLYRYFKWVEKGGLFEVADCITRHFDFVYDKNNDPMAKMRTV